MSRRPKSRRIVETLLNSSPVLILITSLAVGASHRQPPTRTPATSTSINGPTDLAIDRHGHLFVVERIENKVRRIDLQEGTITTVAGNGQDCCYKDGSAATEVSLDFLRSLVIDSQGNLFLGEETLIKKVDGRTGTISTVAGSGKSGNTVEGIGVRAAQFWNIDALAVGSEDTLFAADEHQGKVFMVDPKAGIVQHYAGSGHFGYAGDGAQAVEASFRFPSGLATDKDGGLIVTDFQNCAIRTIDHETRKIRTIAVTGGREQNCQASVFGNSQAGPYPSNPVSDSAGNIYFLEGAMDLVLRIDASTSAISIVAGNGRHGFSGDNGPAMQAELGNPSGLAVDLGGNIFIAEYTNNRVRRVDAKTKVITTIAGNGLPHRIEYNY